MRPFLIAGMLGIAGQWFVGCSTPAPPAPPELLQPADEAARAWLQLVDDGSYDASWDAASPAIQAAVKREEWAPMVGGIRQPLGAVKSRELSGSRHTMTMPGGPDGPYVILTYQTAFEHKASAVETVTPHKGADGVWKVSGYYIK